jgi:hypothetical protein
MLYKVMDERVRILAEGEAGKGHEEVVSALLFL